MTTAQPGTALVNWDPNSGAALPAYLSDALGDMGTNIPDRQTVPSLSYEGKTWTIVKDGNKTKLQAQNTDGDMVPVPVMRAVILNFNADRGRSYYTGTYNPAASTAPVCWSPDGKAPDASVKEKQSATCANCPMSVKGSKVQDGREMVACSSHRMIAIAPAFDLQADPLRLKIAVTSDYDKEIVEHGWFAFRQYVDFLKSRGVTHTALVVTKIKFDPNTAYPKLLFALDRVLTQEEVALVKQALANPKVEELLAEKWSAAGVNGTPTNDSDIRPKPEDPSHIHGAGTDNELWWDGDSWVKPWATAPAAPASPPPPPASQQVIEQSPAPQTPAPAPAPVTPEPAQAPAPALPPKPSDPGHIHLAGTENEMWWDGAAWVKPWIAAATAAPEPTPPAPEPVKAPEPAAKPKPTDAGHIHAAGTDGEMWWDGAAWVKPWIAEAAPAAPAAPPAPEPAKVDPIAAAEADGWVKHPDSAGYHYKGQEVVLTTELAGRYAGNASGSASTGTAAAGGGAPASDASSGASTTTTAPTGASPSDAAVPADVQDLLNKWAG